MLHRCRAYQGRVMVAEEGGEVVGFLCVLARVPEQQVDDTARPHAMVGELYLAPEQRSQGTGRRLLEAGEAFARDRGAERLRVQVLAANGVARSLYASAGFHERLIELEKRLD
ncbi:MAG: GNAT family N-acetyltransferase [Gammaproteobacteria bacterium]|nr:GNAT family N-acetyltransferase [Gammaproteobacteria bacterium]